MRRATSLELPLKVECRNSTPVTTGLWSSGLSFYLTDALGTARVLSALSLTLISWTVGCFASPKRALWTMEVTIFLINTDRGEWLHLVPLSPGSLTVHLKNTAAGFVRAHKAALHTQTGSEWTWRPPLLG